MNDITPIETVRLKLDRAERHLAELEHDLDAYYAARPIHLDGRFDEKSVAFHGRLHQD